MKVSSLTPDLSVLAEPGIADIDALADQGYRSVIGNRPDGESSDQPNWIALKAAATKRGMEAFHIPVVASQISETDIAAFRTALEKLPKPIAAFCQTGRRSTLLWALANSAGLSVGERISIAKKAGYDLEPFRDLLSKEPYHAQS
jgi:sulfide:quinone oxidoreductase